LTSIPSWRFGWVAGFGGELRLFKSNWLARLEYLHYDFGNSGSVVSSDVVFSPFTTNRSSGDLTADVVRAGLSYKFDPNRFALGYAGVAAPVGGAPFYKAPVAVPWSWAGLYLGAHGGYGWGHDPFDNQSLANGVVLNGVNQSGFVGGFQAGANWQSRSVVGGLEIDISGTGIKGSASNTTVAGGVTSQATQTDKFDSLGSARARVGYLVTPAVLLSGTGGLAWSRLVMSQDTTTAGTPTATVTPSWLFGWAAGLGLEARLGNSNWLGRVEYLHYDFGTGGATQIMTGALPTTVSSFGHITADVVRAGLSYKFDWPGMAGGPYASSAYNAMAAVPPAVAAVWSWSGFYIGGHAGYGWGHDPTHELVTRWNDPALDPDQGPQTILSGPNSRGFLGGFEAGANWQFQSIVGGLEIDLSSTDIKGSASAAGLDPLGVAISATKTTRLDLLGSARARLGYLVRPDILLYGTGGLAWTHLEQTINSASASLEPFIDLRPTATWRYGWVAGAGGQLRLWNTNWLARLEYLHYDFGDSGSSTTYFTDDTLRIVSFITSQRTSGHLTADVVRAGVDYKFD
jgi:outer membrane immunogenic protein